MIMLSQTFPVFFCLFVCGFVVFFSTVRSRGLDEIRGLVNAGNGVETGNECQDETIQKKSRKVAMSKLFSKVLSHRFREGVGDACVCVCECV